MFPDSSDAGSAEGEPARSIRTHEQLALAYDIHSDQRFETEAVPELEPDYFFEDEREAGLIRRLLVRLERDPEKISLDLIVVSGGKERTLATPD